MAQQDKVMQSFVLMILENSSSIEALASSRGGWEVWAQCQVELLIKRFEHKVERAPQAFDSNDMGDLFYRPPTWERGAVIELKCQNKEGDPLFLQRLISDAVKIHGMPRPTYAGCKFYSVGIVVGKPSMAVQTDTAVYGFSPWEEVADTNIWISYLIKE